MVTVLGDLTRGYICILLFYHYFKFLHVDVENGSKMPKYLAYMKYIFMLDGICLFTECLLFVNTREFY